MEVIDKYKNITKENITGYIDDIIFGFDDDGTPVLEQSERDLSVFNLVELAGQWKMKTQIKEFIKKRERDFLSKQQGNEFQNLDQEYEKSGKIPGDFFLRDARGIPLKPIEENICKSIVNDGKFLIIESRPWFYHFDFGSWKLDKNEVMLRSVIGKHLPTEINTSRNQSSILDMVIHDINIQKDFNKMNNHLGSEVCFKNCVMDIETGSIYPHDENYYFTNCIKLNAPNIDSEEMQERWNNSTGKKWIEDIIPDQDDRLMLACYVAYMMTVQTDFQKFLIIQGEGNTGKSTLIRLIKNIIGDENISSLSIDSLVRDASGFAPKSLYGKLANINADIPKTAIKDDTILKLLTGEDTIHTNVKYGEAFDFVNYAKLLFSANEIPINENPSSAFFRRMMILEINKRGDFIQDLEKKLANEGDILLWYFITSYHQYNIKGDKTSPKVPESPNSKKAVEFYGVNCDPISQFLIDECDQISPKGDKTLMDGDKKMIRTHDLFSSYCSWAYITNNKKMSRQSFYKSIQDKGFERKHTKTGDYFTGLSLKLIG